MEVHPPKRILLVVTTGGYTHAAPVLELGKVLADRGHAVEFATLDGQEKWTKGYEFISRVHSLGPGPTEKQMDAHYLRMREWDMSKGLGNSMISKYMFDSFWPMSYHGLKKIMDQAPAARPDMSIGDFFVDAVKDIHVQYHVPIAMVWPQMPMLMMPCSYIPGQPGFQLDGTLTSEKASMWLRFKNEWVIVRALPHILKFFSWTRRMRRKEGVNYDLPTPSKPDYLLFINSFFGLEIPKDLPPLCEAIGPILGDEYPPLDNVCQSFLSSHSKVMYIALGTHIILSSSDTVKITTGVLRLLEEGLIDGVIWAVGKSGRQDMDMNQTYELHGKAIRFGDLVEGKNSQFYFPFFAPQRAILDHDSVNIYYTHGGGSSANEGLFHGKPMLSMGIFSDQIANTARLVGGGVAESLNKFHFTSEELYAKAKKIIKDKDGLFGRNVLRLKRIAHIASRRKHHGADLIEELMYDTELRYQDGKEIRPMHLQTADMRMPLYKARNWDLMAVGAVTILGATGASFALGKLAWTHTGYVLHYLHCIWRK
ncbi:unnamed protein product [Clonostachys byssicola]|uniref:UDP-glucoronosyl and UDP-glucosyl transferase n=1 Tax=Clonostachys byssicola TaxID=160290 RepID=A0A9N9UY61_9HYPO|nr:unnamed protein product [Clonostachys byssicola]